MRKYYLLILLTIAGFTTSFSQNMNTKMLQALEIHERATTFEEELTSAQSFKKISDSNPNEWLPAYWTSFLYSQAGRLTKDKLKYYKIAFDYYARSKKNMGTPSKKQVVYLMALKALLSNLSQGPNFAMGNTKKGIQLAKDEKEAINKGLAAHSDHPLVLAMLGTKTLNEGFRAKPSPDLSKIVMGKTILERAKKLYEEKTQKDKLIPDQWNKTWIDVWLGRLKNRKQKQ